MLERWEQKELFWLAGAVTLNSCTLVSVPDDPSSPLSPLLSPPTSLPVWVTQTRTHMIPLKPWAHFHPPPSELWTPSIPSSEHYILPFPMLGINVLGEAYF